MRLRHDVDNLFGDAIKSTPEGGTVMVSFRTADGGMHLTMRDRGVGTPIEHLSRDFESFYRMEKACSRAEVGAGLGLAIVQSIVSAHRGGWS